jgi:hypothetical protein
MGIEFLLIGAGIAILVVVLARRRLFEKRLIENKEKLAGLKFDSTVPEEVEKIFNKAPRLKGDGSFAYKAVGCIPFADNYEAIRIARRFYFVEPTELEVLLIPEPGNFERKLAVAVTVDSKLLGYVPAKEAAEMHKYLLAHSSGVKARAKIYLGSRPEYNGVMLDFAKPLRLESGRKKDN